MGIPSLFTKAGTPKKNITGRRHAKRLKFTAARRMRKNPTPAEAALWDRLKEGNLEGLRFRRQSILFGWIADFRCPRHKLVIEVDGGYHNTKEKQVGDAKRDLFMRQFGLTIIRVTNEQVLSDIDAVLQKILDAIPGPGNAQEPGACGRRASTGDGKEAMKARNSRAF